MPRKVRVCSPEWNVSALAFTLPLVNSKWTGRCERSVWFFMSRLAFFSSPLTPELVATVIFSCITSRSASLLKMPRTASIRDQPPFALDRSALMA